jgi:hypothetical protein
MPDSDITPNPTAAERKAIWEQLPKPKMDWPTFKRMYGATGDANKALTLWRRKLARKSPAA